MRRTVIGLGALVLAVLAPTLASAQATVKIGLIMPYSGQFADTANQMDNAIKLYLRQKGDTVAGKKIELIRRDTGGVAPDVAASEGALADPASLAVFAQIGRSNRARSD